VAVVTIAHGRHEHLAAQERSLRAGARPPDLRVVVAMDDPAVADLVTGASWPTSVEAIDRHPQGLPLAAARNCGARAAIEGGADVLVFLDVDCLVGPDLVADYADAVAASEDRVWCGPVTYLPPAPSGGYPLDLVGWDGPHAARPAPDPGERVDGGDPDLFWSLSFALARETWERIDGFGEEYVGYGGEDTDFAHRAAERGIGIAWTGGARAYHQHHPVESPPVSHLDDILRNGAIFAERWGRWPMTGWLEAFEEQGLVQRHRDGWRRADGPHSQQTASTTRQEAS
ncbi:galactosyltransferase-related protein, partial [Aeromicrobium sp.]|uniref:glycosyltransferase family 2 protein n=1 Tax=Aeromicrobium sp. TaxID=1871063 RepID=UPI0028A5B429